MAQIFRHVNHSSSFPKFRHHRSHPMTAPVALGIALFFQSPVLDAIVSGEALTRVEYWPPSAKLSALPSLLLANLSSCWDTALPHHATCLDDSGFRELMAKVGRWGAGGKGNSCVL